ncbi:C-type lectin mannose-binding isoform-like [Alligator sinensis]|uniref:C-type lectin mannose-binding isoform-like n=1 Tax=Alligator sinensis TaxID=38654 RepID=A0A3Q0FTE4_ALLSI|nr:C-type lectin mannose-binding isoform-like [Alligator sinensis]
MRTAAHLILCLLGCLVLSPWLEGAPVQKCRKDWLRYGNNCYRLFRQRKTWEDAEVECQSYSPWTHLATIHSNRETNVVSSYILRNPPDGPVWIGIHDARHNGAWTWTDGSIYHYRAWNNGEPNNLDWVEYCAELLEYKRK